MSRYKAESPTDFVHQEQLDHQYNEDVAKMLAEFSPQELAEMVVNRDDAIETMKLEHDEETENLSRRLHYTEEEVTDLKAQNRVLTDTISDERSSYKAGMQSIKASITEQVQEMKGVMQEMRQALTGSLKDVLRWRKDNGINDRTELGQIVQQASKPARKQDHETTGPRLN